MKNFVFLAAFMLGQFIAMGQMMGHKPQAKVSLTSAKQAEIIRLSSAVQGVSYQQHLIGGKTYQSIDMPDMSSMLIQGAPDLQLITASVIIPDNENMRLKVTASSYVDYKNVNIAPSKGNLTRDIDPNNIPYEFGNVYAKDAFFPGKLAEMRSPYIFRDFRAQTVVFYPYQYNPVTKVLRVYQNIEVELVKEENGIIENPFVRTGAPAKVSQEFHNLYAHQFLNYSQAKYTPLPEAGRMLIIADNAFTAAMQPYITWKTRVGRKVEMVSVQSVGNTATAIKNYISTYYTTHSDLAFVLLVGDATQVKTNNLSGNHSDNYYGYLAGNDSYSEVIIGRFSAETVAHVEAQVSRTIEYETTPGVNNGSYARCLGLSSNQGPGDDNEYDYTHIRNMQADLAGFTYAYNAELFDGSQGGDDLAGDPTQTMVSKELNDGSGIVLYTGHGSSSSFVSSGFNNNNITSLANAGKLPFIWSVACVNGDFVGNTCFAEYWMRSTDNYGNNIGAVATLMSTINQSWDPPMDGQDEMVDILVESYTNNIKRTFGGLSIAGCMKMNDTYGAQGESMTDTWTIFGDPTLMVRTDTPMVLTVNHSSALTVGMTQFAVNVNVDDALVALTSHDSIYATALSSNGIANLTFGAIGTVDTFHLVVTAFNHIPYQTDMMAISTNLPFLTSIHHYINDSLSNNNQEVENGESVRLALCLKNVGGVATNGVTATLRTNSSLVQITDSTHAYGTLSSGDTLMADQAFAFDVVSQVANGAMIPFEVSIEDGNGDSWMSYINISVNAPELAVINNEAIEQGGNGNGTPDAGETFTLNFKLKNTGNNDLQNILCNFSSASSYVTFNNSSVTVNSLALSAEYTCTVDATISSSTPDGERIYIDFDAQNGVFQAADQLSFRVGVIDEDFETGDFTSYTWVLDGDKDWVTDPTIKYEGAYSAKSGLTTTDDNKTSTLQLNVNVKTTDSISFYVKVSCEDGSDWNQWYDYLDFKIGNVVRDKWQGELDWTRVAYPVTAGPKVLKWTYRKDAYMSGGNDCAWVDYIVFPPLQDNTALEENQISIESKIYPNPTQNFIQVDFALDQSATVKISLYGVDGRLVKQLNQTAYLSGSHSERISLSELESGTYFVVVETDNNRKATPIIKL